MADAPTPIEAFPAQRLLAAAAFVAAPLLTLGLAADAARLPCAAALALVVFAAWQDRRGGFRRLRGLALRDAPPQDLTVGKTARVDLWLENRDADPAAISIAPPALRDSPVAPFAARSPDPGKAVRLSFDLAPVRRERVFPGGLAVEAHSPLGLWQLRRIVPWNAEFRVQPDWARVVKAMVLALETGVTSGVATHRPVGKGREFDHLRAYIKGDEYSDIDWRATARRGAPVTRVQRIERTREVYIVIDHSRLSRRLIRSPGDAVPRVLLERMIVDAMALALMVQREGDLAGLVTVARGVTHFLPAGAGAAHQQAMRAALVGLQPDDGSADFQEMFVQLGRRVRKRALLILLTDLSDPLYEDELAAGLRALASRHLVLVGMARDADLHGLFEGDAPADLRGAVARLAGEMSMRSLRDAARRLSRLGAEFALLPAGDLGMGLYQRYLNLKRRQAL